jgi:hypothetical protein
LTYAYADFTASCSNWGNHIIEYATIRLLSESIGPPAHRFDSLTDAPIPADDGFILLPGCTMLTPGHYPALNRLGSSTTPVFCFAGSLWEPLPPPGRLLRSRVVGRGEHREPDLSLARRLEPPVGCRDSYTYRALRKASIPALYVGCPTLFMPDDGVADDGYVLFSFGRRDIRGQVRASEALGKERTLIGLAHEEGDYQRALAAGWRFPLVRYEDDIELYLSYYKRASAVITGRLHGALPAMAYGKPLFYFGTRDSRTTMLDDLGVTIHPVGTLPRALRLATTARNQYVVDSFSANQAAWLSGLAESQGRGATA